MISTRPPRVQMPPAPAGPTVPCEDAAMPHPPKVVLFDADGVVQQTPPGWEAELHATLGSPPYAEELLRDLFTAELPALAGDSDFAEVTREVLARFGLADRAEDVLAFWTRLELDAGVTAADPRAAGRRHRLLPGDQPARAAPRLHVHEPGVRRAAGRPAVLLRPPRGQAGPGLLHRRPRAHRLLRRVGAVHRRPRAQRARRPHAPVCAPRSSTSPPAPTRCAPSWRRTACSDPGSRTPAPGGSGTGGLGWWGGSAGHRKGRVELDAEPAGRAGALAGGPQPAQPLDEHRVGLERGRAVDEGVEHLVVARGAHVEQLADRLLLGAGVLPPLPLEGEDLAVALAQTQSLSAPSIGAASMGPSGWSLGPILRRLITRVSFEPPPMGQPAPRRRVGGRVRPSCPGWRGCRPRSCSG